MSSIQSLPPEIISHIAEMCTWDCDAISDSRYASYARYHAALARTNRLFHHILNYALYKRNLRYDPQIHSCVLWAVRNGRLETLKKAHGYGADLNSDGTAGRPLLHWSFRMVITAPLHIALYHQHSHIVEYLLEAGVNVHVPSSNLCHCLGRRKPVYPLHTALAHGVIEDVERLIQHGAYLVADNNSAIFDVADMGRTDLLNLLLDRTDPFSLSASLRFAAATQDVALATRLLAQPGIDVNATDWKTRSALHFAVSSTEDDTSLIELLLQHPETDLSVMDRFNLTAIHMAADRGHNLLAELFVTHKRVPPAQHGLRGQYPLHYGARSGDKRLVELLLKQPGSSIHHVDEEGRTALHYVCHGLDSRNGFELIKFLISGGLSINQLSSDGTALSYAARAYKLDTMALLLSLGSDPLLMNSIRTDLDGWSYLHYVLWEPNGLQTKLTRELIARGADVNLEAEEDSINAPDEFGSGGPPLFFAAAGAKSLECMELLLKAGAKTDSVVQVPTPAINMGQTEGGEVGSMLSGLFRHLWNDGSSLSEPSLEEAVDRINLLLDHETPLGKVYGRSSALQYACDAASRGKPHLLRLLTKRISITNTDTEHLNALIVDYEHERFSENPKCEEIVTLLSDAKARLSAEALANIEELNASMGEQQLGQ